MRISTDVVVDMLSSSFALARYGLKARKRDLVLPAFYEPKAAVRKDAVYVARTEDLTRKPPENCLVFCVGPKPSPMRGKWPCEVVHVQDSGVDLFAVFNELQRIFGLLLDWNERMQALSAEGADVRRLVKASIELFDNRITVTDYDLNILAYCCAQDRGGVTRIAMSDEYERVPAQIMMALPPDNLSKSMHLREPFLTMQPDRPACYCVNLFAGNDYVGCCSLQEEQRPIRDGDLELFGVFAQYVRQALVSQAEAPGGQLVTLRTVFDQLLKRYPVSARDVARAMELARMNLGDDAVQPCRWRCAVMRSSSENRSYPPRYLCASAEEAVPNSVALCFDEAVVLFVLAENAGRDARLLSALQGYLQDMGFEAGVSRAFDDVFAAYGHYRQALAALETTPEGSAACAEAEGAGRCRMFDDVALDYMLDHCCGEFDADLVVDPALDRLAESSANGVDYVGTLRAYLDNNCNANRTAKAMYLHRSTLVQRLDHIQRYVSLDTPRQRLYLQLCLHLKR